MSDRAFYGLLIGRGLAETPVVQHLLAWGTHNLEGYQRHVFCAALQGLSVFIDSALALKHSLEQLDFVSATVLPHLPAQIVASYRALADQVRKLVQYAHENYVPEMLAIEFAYMEPHTFWTVVWDTLLNANDISLYTEGGRPFRTFLTHTMPLRLLGATNGRIGTEGSVLLQQEIAADTYNAMYQRLLSERCTERLMQPDLQLATKQARIVVYPSPDELGAATRETFQDLPLYDRPFITSRR
jgi:hypothetical protein